MQEENLIPKKVKYVHKRIQCENCNKKFNKIDTFRAHMQKYHKETIVNAESHIDINNINARRK